MDPVHIFNLPLRASDEESMEALLYSIVEVERF